MPMVLPSLPDFVIESAKKYLHTHEKNLLDISQFRRAFEVAQAADQIVQRIGVVIPTSQEAVDAFLGAPMPPSIEKHQLGAVVQDSHTTSSIDVSRFHRGLIFGGEGNVLGYSNHGYRIGAGNVMADLGPWVIADFWGIMKTRNADGTGVAAPYLGLMKNTNPTRKNQEIQWGFKLSSKYSDPGYFVPFNVSE